MQDQEDSDKDRVISQFYYSLKLDKPAHVEIGLHQEDERILGADRRPYLDASYIILKKTKTSKLEFVGTAELENGRDVEASFNLDAGQYLVVPYTTGALMRKSVQKKPPVPLKVDLEGKKVWNLALRSTLYDVFRKIDLQFDGILSVRELNMFGHIIDDPVFKNLNEQSFSQPEFSKISRFSDGLTRFGLYQIVNNYSEEKMRKILDVLGYDESLQSTKSRVFILTFHSTENIR